MIGRSIRNVLHARYRATSRLVGSMMSRILTSEVECTAPGAGIFTGGLRPRVQIRVARGARIQLAGRLVIGPWYDYRTPVVISCGEGARLTIDGDFTIGAGVRIVLSEGAELRIGGRRNEPGSGITEHSLIFVKKRISIGADFMCAWNTYITDCDWHGIVGVPSQADTTIGDHVWIAPNASILKGCDIGDGSIVATGAVAHKLTTPSNALAAGVPCRVVALNKQWTYAMTRCEPSPTCTEEALA